MSTQIRMNVERPNGELIDSFDNPTVIPSLNTKIKCGPRKVDNTQEEFFIVDITTHYSKPGDPINRTTITCKVIE